MSTQTQENTFIPIAEELLQLDDVSRKCGFFNGETCVNNHYGCDAPNNDEFEYVKLNDISTYVDEKKFQYALLRRKFGSYHQIMANKEEASIYWQEAKYDPKKLAEVNVKMQGKCYSFSCPVAYSVDLEEMKTRDAELYKYYLQGGAEEDDELGEGGDTWMIMHQKSANITN